MCDPRRMIPLAFLFFVVIFLSPAPVYSQEEVWELVITGETEATCDMILNKVEQEEDTYTVTAKFQGK